MDKLGQSALHGLKCVIRQSLWNGHYALIDKYGQPNPVHKECIADSVTYKLPKYF